MPLQHTSHVQEPLENTMVIGGKISVNISEAHASICGALGHADRGGNQPSLLGDYYCKQSFNVAENCRHAQIAVAFSLLRQ